MTDIELADEYYNTIPYRYADTEDDYSSDIKKAFLAGLKAGRPQWHDLRKDENDLPDNDRVVSDQEGTNVRYVKRRNKWFYLDRTGEANIIAWCEIPQYKE